MIPISKEAFSEEIWKQISVTYCNLKISSIIIRFFILPKNISKAQLATEGIAVVSPGSRFAKVLGGFANVLGQLTNLSKVLSLTSKQFPLSSFIFFEIATIELW